MVSKMAISDIEALKEDGIELTPQEIIRLNAFGLKVERNTESAEYSVPPRVSILGDVAFHEPTIGSEVWMQQVGNVFDMDEAGTYFQLRAYSLSRDWRELPPPLEKEKVKEQTTKFFKEQLGSFTMRQLQNALEYAIFGNDPTAHEMRSKFSMDKDDDGEEDENEKSCYEVGLMRQGIMFKIGSPDEIKDMTPSEVRLYIEYNLQMKFGSQKTKSEHSKNLGEYYTVLDEIKNNHSQEVIENG